MQTITYTANIHDALCKSLQLAEADRVFVLVDDRTLTECLPRVRPCLPPETVVIAIAAGDDNKTSESLSRVWLSLSENGASRRSLLVNLGGGMITDLGGFAAATFKRGIRFLNLPTTLLSMVDAAVGGKTGINFNGLKNEVGAFKEAEEVIIYAPFLLTLDKENLLSGYAEMIKHGLLSSRKTWAAHLSFDPLNPALEPLERLIRESIAVKRSIVEADPYEAGLRKSLNLGHTFGHAIESLSLERHAPLLHGYAVAYGLICDLYLSAAYCGFPQQVLRQTATFIRNLYGAPTLTCKDYPRIYELTAHDKKNVAGSIRTTLLEDIGAPRLDYSLTRDDIYEALDFLREG